MLGNVGQTTQEAPMGKSEWSHTCTCLCRRGTLLHPTNHRLLARVLPSHRACHQAPCCSLVSAGQPPLSAKSLEGNI